MRYGYDDYDDNELRQMKALNSLRPQYRKWVNNIIQGEDYFSGMDLDDALKEAYDMQQADEHYYTKLYKSLKPEYQKMADELMCDGYDDFKAIDEACDQQQADEHYYEVEKMHQPTREERYPGVVFTPQPKINTICEDDDIAF